MKYIRKKETKVRVKLRKKQFAVEFQRAFPLFLIRIGCGGVLAGSTRHVGH
jgi:hypothetical protein